MSIGLPSGTVRLARHSAEWQQRFVSERGRLARCLPGRGTRIEHIGSTAIPGLIAKPIIDIAVSIPTFRRLAFCTRALEAAGYTYKGEYGLPGRHFFVYGEPVVYHLHLVRRTSKHWTRWLLFRDYLLLHPAEVRAYNTLKRSLARQYAGNRDAYTRAKTPFVEAVLKRARQALSGHPAPMRGGSGRARLKKT